MSRHARHTRRLEATKEFLVPCSGGTEASRSGAHVGYLIDDNDEWACSEVYLPWDFAKIVDINIAFIPIADLDPMTMRVTVDFAGVGYSAQATSDTADRVIANCVTPQIMEHGILDLVNLSPLGPRTYMGVEMERVATMNTNALILGVRIRYNTPIYAQKL